MTLIEEIKKPFNIITLTLTVVSLILSVFFYFDGKKEKNISYQLVEPTSLIFDSKNSSSKIKLFERDSILITDNVYVQTGTIWNSGDFPILKSDIRKQMAIKLNGAKRILDFKIVKQKDASIANFKLMQGDVQSINIGWEYFDPTYGFVFQVIYIGEDNPKFELQGKILDISGFSKVKQDEKIDKKIWIALIIAYSLMTLFLVWRIYRRRNQKGRFDKVYLLMLVSTIAILIYMVFFKVFTNADIPI